MAISIVARLPDLTELLGSRSSLLAGLASIRAPVPADPASLTQAVTALLDGLSSASPEAAMSRVSEAVSSLGAARGRIPAGSLPAVTALQGGLSSALQVLEPARSILGAAAGGGALRDLKDVVLERAGNPDDFLNGVVSTLKTLVPAEAADTLMSFVSAIRDFEASVPDAPGEIASFLARAFLGLPGDLLAQPLSLLTGFRVQVHALADPNRLTELPVRVASAAEAMAGAAALLRTLAPGDPQAQAQVVAQARAALQGAKTSVDALVSALQALASDFGTGVSALNPGGLVVSLVSALQAVPEIAVARLDDFVDLVTKPLRDLNAKLEGTAPRDLTGFLQGATAHFESLIREEGFDPMREAALAPFREVGGLIRGLDLESIRAALVGIFQDVGGAVSQATSAFGAVRDGLGTLRSAAQTAADGIGDAGNALQSALGDLIRAVETALGAVSLTEFKDRFEGVFAQLDGLLHEVQPSVVSVRQGIQTLGDTLAGFEIADAAQAVRDALVAIRDLLAAVDVTLIAGDVKLSFQGSVEFLRDIDLEPVFDELRAALENVHPGALVGEMGELVRSLQREVEKFHPAAILDPLQGPFAEALSALTSADPAALLDPVIGRLRAVRGEVGGLLPTIRSALDPLATVHAEIRSALDLVAPTALLAPAGEVFDGLLALVSKLDPAPLLRELDGLFTGWLETGVTGIQEAGNALGSADLKGLLDDASPGSGGPEFGYMPGDMLRPVADLYRKILGLLDRAPSASLLAAFREVRDRFVGAVDGAANLVSDTQGLVRERLAAFDVRHRFELVSDLHAAYGDLVLALDSVDPVHVRAEVRADFDALGQIVVALNPNRALAPVRTSLAGLEGSAAAVMRGVDVSGIAPVLGPVARRLRALVPDFLRGEITAEAIRQGLEALNPGRIADEVDAEFERFLLSLSRFGDALVAELPKIGRTLETGTTAFLPQLLADAFGEVYGPIVEKLQVLNPRTFAAEVEDALLGPVRRALDGLAPEALIQDLGLETALGAVTSALDGVIAQLEQLRATVADRWTGLVAGVSALSPATLAASAEATLDRVRVLLNQLDLSELLESLEVAADRIRAELEQGLEEVREAFEEMKEAIPT